MATTCLYKEIHPPTAVTHAAAGYITHLDRRDQQADLVISRGTELAIYSVRRGPAASPGKDGVHTLPPALALELVCAYPLAGAVESLAVLKSRSESQLDAVLLAFRDAKLSVVEWDVAQHTLRVTSLHSFEGEPALRRGKQVFPVGPRVICDPLGRFAAVLVYDNQLAILPAVEADLVALAAGLTYDATTVTLSAVHAGPEARGASGSTALVPALPREGPPGSTGAPAALLGNAAAVGNSYVLSLGQLGGASGVDMWGGGLGGGGGGGGELGGVGAMWRGGDRPPRPQPAAQAATPGVGSILEARDAVLLHGYHEPVLLVLHLPEPYWVGRPRDRKDGCVVCAVSLGLRRKKHSVLWAGAGLPSDSLRLVAVPQRPLALLLTPCAIILVQQGNQHGVLVGRIGEAGEPRSRPDLDALSEMAMTGESPAALAASLAQKYGTSVAPEALPSMYRGMPRAQGLDVDLRGAAAAWLGGDCCIVSAASGQVLAVRLRTDGPAHQRIQVSEWSVAPAPPPAASCVVDLGGGCVFMGTACGDSVVLQRQPKPQDAAATAGKRKRRRTTDDTAPAAVPAVKQEGQQQADGVAQAAADGVQGGENGAEAGEGAGEAAVKPGEGEEEGDGEADEEEDGEETKPSIPAEQLVVVDTLPGIGPVRDMVLVDTSAAQTPEAGQGATRGGPTLLTASGAERSSAVLMLRPGLVPELVTEVGVAGITAMVAIHHRREEVLAPPEDAEPGALIVQPAAPRANAGAPFHAFLLLTHAAGRTMVLETGEELQEVTETSTFVTSQPQLAAGNLFNLAGICQVLPTAVCVFDGPDLIQELSVEEIHTDPQRAEGVTITSAQVCDPYVALQLSDGSGALLVGEDVSMTLAAVPEAAGLLAGGSAPDQAGARVAAVCLYKDESRWLAGLLDGGSDRPTNHSSAPPTSVKAEPHAGTSLGAAHDVHMADTGAGSPALPEPAPPAGLPVPQHFMAVSLLDGSLHIVRLPDCTHAFSTPAAGGGGEVLLQAPGHTHPPSGAAAPPPGPPVPGPQRITEMRIESFSETAPGSGAFPPCERPVLVALTATGSLLCYQAFDRGPGADAGRPAQLAAVGVKADPGGAVQQLSGDPGAQPCRDHRLGWRRLAIDGTGHQEAATAPGAPPAPSGTARRLSRFDNLAYMLPDGNAGGGLQCGVFVAGARPLWLFASRGGLVPHPMTIDGPVLALTPFHNVNCPHGFILSCASGSLKVCHLPFRERLDTHWALRKVRLPGSAVVHRLAHLPATNMLAVAGCRALPPRPHPPEAPGSDPMAAAAYAGVAAVAEARGVEDAFEVRVLQLPQLAPVPGLRAIACAPGEVVQAMRNVAMRRAPGSDATLNLLAIGSAFLFGEDYPCLGRISLYSLQTRKKAAAAGGTALWSSLLVATRNTAGPVTSVHEFKGMLLAAVSKTVELYSLRPPASSPAANADGGAAGPAAQQMSLVKTAFFDAPILITSLALVKDFILVGDVQKGCTFLRFNESTRLLEQLSRDFDDHAVLAAGYLINGSKLLLGAADAGGTLHQAEYVRSHPAAWGGQKLVAGGALHIGQTVTRLTGIKLTTAAGGNRHGLLVSTASGAWGCWAPVWDVDAAARLAALQALLVHALPHTAGLNPRAFRRRYLRTPRALGGGDHWGPQHTPEQPAPPPSAMASLHAATGSRILDGDVLWRFPLLPRAQQAALAAKAGAVTVEQLLMDLTAWAVATTI